MNKETKTFYEYTLDTIINNVIKTAVNNVNSATEKAIDIELKELAYLIIEAKNEEEKEFYQNKYDGLQAMLNVDNYKELKMEDYHYKYKREIRNIVYDLLEK